MNELKVFQNSEFGQLEVLLLDGKEYFPATACARLLGYKDVTNAIKQHCRWVVKHHLPHPQNPAKSIEMKFIPEGDLYRLIIRSKLPAAEKFERWVMDEVLPAIRKQGAYVSLSQVPDIIQQTATAVVTEVVRQLVPMLTQSLSGRDVIDSAPDEVCTTTTIITETRRKRRNTQGKIEKLPQEIYAQVADMLQNRFSYKEIQSFLAAHGFQMSQMAISRYYNKGLEGKS